MQNEPQRIQALADKIRALLNAEERPIAISALAVLSGEVLGSISIAPPYTRAASLQLFCQQVSDITAAVEDRSR
jgi:hypothetical protein